MEANSTEQTIDGTEDADIGVSITALDQQVYGATDQNKDYAPVVVSVATVASGDTPGAVNTRSVVRQ